MDWGTTTATGHVRESGGGSAAKGSAMRGDRRTPV